METTMDHSPTLGQLAKALAAAQGELENAKLDRFNPHFRNKYASLASIRAAITPVLSKHGFAISQTNEPHGDAGVCVVTMLMHVSGEWLRGRLFMPVEKKTAQGFGSAISYARRYALGEIANIATDEDDDGEQASRPAAPRAVEAPPAHGPSVDVDALVKALASATNAKELSEASLAVGRAKAKLAPADIERCRAAHDAKMRELEKAA